MSASTGIRTRDLSGKTWQFECHCLNSTVIHLYKNMGKGSCCGNGSDVILWNPHNLKPILHKAKAQTNQKEFYVNQSLGPCEVFTLLYVNSVYVSRRLIDFLTIRLLGMEMPLAEKQYSQVVAFSFATDPSGFRGDFSLYCAYILPLSQ